MLLMPISLPELVHTVLARVMLNSSGETALANRGMWNATGKLQNIDAEWGGWSRSIVTITLTLTLTVT